jgi:hypothetical protein
MDEDVEVVVATGADEESIVLKVVVSFFWMI